MNKISIKNILLTILIIVFAGIFMCSLYKIIIWKLNVDKNNSINKELNKELIHKNNKYDINLKKLKEKNNDVIAYLKVNNTNINYVVVKTKNNSYYLKHNFNKEYNKAGWIFADYRNKFNGSDKNIIIYGHDTKDGSMFGSLKKVLNKDWQQNKRNLKIKLITEKKKYTYKVFSTYSIEPEEYYLTTAFNKKEDYYKFLSTIKKRSNYDYKTLVNKTDKVLTLSSCIGRGEKRVVLHAKLIKEKNR